MTFAPTCRAKSTRSPLTYSTRHSVASAVARRAMATRSSVEKTRDFDGVSYTASITSSNIAPGAAGDVDVAQGDRIKAPRKIAVTGMDRPLLGRRAHPTVDRKNGIPVSSLADLHEFAARRRPYPGRIRLNRYSRPCSTATATVRIRPDHSSRSPRPLPRPTDRDRAGPRVRRHTVGAETLGRRPDDPFHVET